MRVAIEELEKARAFDPLWCMIDATIGIAHYFLRDFAKAEKHLKDALQLDQDHMITQFFLGKVLVELRRTPQAIAVLQQTYERSGKNPMPLAEIAYAHARAGDHAAARATLEALRALRDGTRFVSSGLEGIVCAALGESDEAIRLFERAVEERATDLQWLGVHPGLDAIRAHPRFLALLRGIRLRPAST
jgi:tetratricopeptide (TPR) repeat protein